MRGFINWVAWSALFFTVSAGAVVFVAWGTEWLGWWAVRLGAVASLIAGLVAVFDSND